MDYNDFKLASNESIEAMAKEYNKALLKQGFMFVRLNDEKDEKDILIQSIKNGINSTLSLLKKLTNYSLSKQNFIDAEKLYYDVKSEVYDYFNFNDINISNVAVGKYEKSLLVLVQNLSKLASNLLLFKENYEKNANFDKSVKNILKIIELLTE